MEDSYNYKNKLTKRPNLKLKSDNNSVKKQVIWDDKKIEEQEIEQKLHPKMKILEPKTPYTGTVNDLTN